MISKYGAMVQKLPARDHRHADLVDIVAKSGHLKPAAPAAYELKCYSCASGSARLQANDCLPINSFALLLLGRRLICRRELAQLSDYAAV